MTAANPSAKSTPPVAGYSARPLIDKLGIKPAHRGAILDAPAGYLALLGDLPAGIIQRGELGSHLDFVQYFVMQRDALEQRFAGLKAALAPTGMLWISWPKRAAKLPTDLDENVVRAIGLAHGLVDVKVIAVDPVWSGLKFVYRLADRPQPAP